MYITEEDARMLEGSVEIMKQLFGELRDMSAKDASRDLSELDKTTQEKYRRKDKKDTKLFDIIAEDAITYGNRSNGHIGLMHRAYDQSGVVITEECGRTPREMRIEHVTPVIISDPVDSTAYFKKIMKDLGQPEDKVGAVFDREVERVGEPAARRHACSSSVTLIKDNAIKYTVAVNLLTGDIYVAYPKGVFRGDVKSTTRLADVSQQVEFSDEEDLTMLCYTRDSGKYETNRRGTHLRFFPLHASAKNPIGPVGPLRFTYLVNFGDGSDSGIGVVGHNGEKVQELLPNIAVAYFSGGRLHAYKLFCDPEDVEERDGKDMTPTLANSLYGDGRIANTGVKSTFLNNHEYPSAFRDTTVIISPRNEAALTMMTGMVERDFAVRIV